METTRGLQTIDIRYVVVACEVLPLLCDFPSSPFGQAAHVFWRDSLLVYVLCCFNLLQHKSAVLLLKWFETMAEVEIH